MISHAEAVRTVSEEKWKGSAAFADGFLRSASKGRKCLEIFQSDKIRRFDRIRAQRYLPRTRIVAASVGTLLEYR